MGSCSSVHRNQETNMKHLRLSFCSKTEKLVIPPTPIKEKPKNGNFLVDLKSQWSPSKLTTTINGSKEEVFFESKAWLDSDCDDDFYSVNGEFTPSRGSTPVHHTFGNKTPSQQITPGTSAELSPTVKKKKLLELFRESVREVPNYDVTGKTSSNEKKEVKPIINDILPKSAHSTPYISGRNSACSSERTSNGDDHASIIEKSVKSAQRCLPSLASCRSFSERRRKTSPAIAAANGNA